MIFTLVPAQHVNPVWLKALPHVRKLVEEAEGRVTELSVYEEVASGQKLFWAAMEDDGSRVYGFITTTINQYPKLKMASLEYCAGEDADSWFIGLMEVIEHWAKSFGCDGIEMVCGRRGWTRKFKQAGFSDKFTWAVKKFEKDQEYGQGQ